MLAGKTALRAWRADRSRRAGRLARCAALFALTSSGCSESEPRAQVVLHVDLDLLLPDQIDASVSPDAAVDTLRIEIYGSDRGLVDDRLFVLATATDLPVSFGIPADASPDGRVLVRIRAFRALFATPGNVGGDPVLDPWSEVTVDRAVALALPSEGIVTRNVTLHGECIGRPIRLGIAGQPDRTCVDAAHLDVEATEGIADGEPSGSVAGTWSRAQSVECPESAPVGVRCVPGGLSILGDARFQALNELDYDSVPPRVVYLSPFYLDETEVTVGELRALVDGGYEGPMPSAPDPTSSFRRFCTWEESVAADLPLNCLGATAGDAICAARGGRVPTEAEWEHAARGRGERRLYTWGDDAPACCTTSVARVTGGGCVGQGPEPVASHRGDEDCESDVSRDDIVDLTGSVAELTLDSVASFADECWDTSSGSPILDDPVCRSASGRIARGASWSMVFGDAPLPIRRIFIESDHGYGVRCAYEAAP